MRNPNLNNDKEELTTTDKEIEKAENIRIKYFKLKYNNNEK